MEPIQVIAWTYVAVFAITALLTLGGIVDTFTFIQIPEPYLRKLFYALILEIVVGGVAIGSNFLTAGDLLSTEDSKALTDENTRLREFNKNWKVANVKLMSEIVRLEQFQETQKNRFQESHRDKSQQLESELANMEKQYKDQTERFQKLQASFTRKSSGARVLWKRANDDDSFEFNDLVDIGEVMLPSGSKGGYVCRVLDDNTVIPGSLVDNVCISHHSNFYQNSVANFTYSDYEVLTDIEKFAWVAPTKEDKFRTFSSDI